ncbi:MAG: hypothetical protein ABJE66_15505 [Deltaproteobacteria bacterium]
MPTFLSTIDAMFVCENSDGTFNAHETRTTDADDLGAYCDVTVPREQLTVSLVEPELDASFDAYDFHSVTRQSNEQFSIQVPIPKVDVIVHDSTRLALLRNVDTRDGPSDITVDMASAPAMRTGHYTYDPPDSDETLGDLNQFATANGTSTAFFYVGVGSYRLPDSSLVAPTDIAYAEVDASSSVSGRRVSRTNPDPDAPFATHWLPRITGTIDRSRTAAAFDPFDVPYDFIGVDCQATSGYEGLSITGAYRDIRADDIAFDEDVPGWRWSITDDHRVCGGSLGEMPDANTYSDTYFEVYGPTPSSAAPSGSHCFVPSRPARARRRR